MEHEIKIPELGESVSEGVIVAWLQDDGAVIEANTPVLELETDKVTMEIESLYAGRLSVKIPAESTVKVGQVVATVDTSAAAEEKPRRREATEKEPPPKDEEPPPIAPASGMPQAAAKASEAGLSPAVRRLVREHGLDPNRIAPTGPGDRITKADVLRHIESSTAQQIDPTTSPRTTNTETGPQSTGAPAPGDGSRQTRVRMSKLRARIAERLVAAQHTAAILTTFNEADMSKVIEWRARHKQLFKEKHDVGLGFMSFFVKAAVDALKTVPRLNAQIDGDEIVQNNFYDIGVAVGTEQGLLVPVIRDCDGVGFAEIERRILDVARRARTRKITLEELSGGCFTVSNGGVYGSMLSTPILNPPQSGILGLHAIKKRPVVVDDEIVIRPMMYLALSYDHRIVDGSEAVTFLKRIVECIEHPERMMLSV